MIVNLRGTSGAGKSTIVRAVMKRYSCEANYVDGRRRPLFYVGHRPEEHRLLVPGHYETACGGCDTIRTPDEVYELVRWGALEQGMDVLFEGIMVQDEIRRCAEVSQLHPTLVIGLDVPIEECLASVQRRRDARGDARPLNPKNTVARATSLERTYHRLVGLGVKVERHGREAALSRVLEVLG